MSLFSKIVLILPVLAMLAIMEAMTYKPEIFWILFSILIAIVILISLYLGGFLLKRKLRQLVYIILPLFYTLGALFLFVLAQKSVAQQFFVVITSLILGIVLYTLALLNKYRFSAMQEVILKSEEEKRKRIVLALSQALLLLVSFFISASLFAIIYLLSFPIWQALLLASIAFWGLTFQFLSEIFTLSQAPVYASIIALVAIQLFWALTFWPTNYIANAVIIAIALYIILGILENYSRASLTGRMIKVYFMIALLTISGILLTAQWKPII